MEQNPRTRNNVDYITEYFIFSSSKIAFLEEKKKKN